ncbi:MAG: CamS family sex pheromone protein [Aerococcus sp.]|nr:CamS family sex pheromone protein [Aerococcus sp.]
MKARRLLKSSLLVASVLVMGVGCQVLPDSTPNQASNEAGTSQNEPQTEKGYYPAVIKDDQYPLNEARGLSVGTSSQANREQMERSTYQMLSETFPTTDYRLREGQVITKDQLSSWLGAKNNDNKDGLNPEKSASDKENDFEPHYLNTILEYDLLGNKQDTKDKLQAISLTLVLNQEDQASADSKVVAIDKDTAIKQGKTIAQEVLNRLRQKEEYKQIPIQFYLFYNAPADDLSGGSVVASTQVSPDSRAFGDWTTYNTEQVTLGVDKAPNQEDTTNFERYREEVATVFPELSGLSGVATYEDGKLEQLTITVHTPFDGYSETAALTQQAITKANSTFSKNINIKIKVQGPSGNTALAERAGGGEFSMMIF